MAKKNILIAAHDDRGNIVETFLESADALIAQYEQVGIDDCSTDLSLRGYPVVRGLVGPIPESKTTVRYEAASAFEVNTKQWAATKIKRRRRTKAAIEAELQGPHTPAGKTSTTDSSVKVGVLAANPVPASAATESA